MYNFLIFLFFIISILSSKILFATDDSSKFDIKNYTISDGLPSNNINTCIQDDEGYIWFCTDAGLCKFNGDNFETINLLNFNIENDEIIYSFKDHKNSNIWFYTIKGAYINYSKGNFKKIDLINYYNKKYKADNCRMYSSSFWIVSKGYIIDCDNDIKYNITFPNNIYYVKKIDDKKIIINNSVFSVENINHLVKGSSISNQFDEYYCKSSTYNNSLILNYSKDKINYSYYFDSIKFCKLNLLNIDTRNYIISNNMIYGAGFTGGIIEYNLTTNKYNKYLSNYVCPNIYKDRSNNIWVLTRSNGVFLLQNQIQNIVYQKEKSFYFTNLYDSIIFTGDNKGNIYTFKNNNLINKTNALLNIDHGNARILGNTIYNLNTIIISDLGLIKIDKETNVSLLMKNACKHIVSHNNVIYFSSSSKLFKYENDSIIFIKDINYIKQLFIYNNDLFILTSNQLLQYKKNKFEIINSFNNIDKIFIYNNKFIYYTNDLLILTTANKFDTIQLHEFNINNKVLNVLQNQNSIWLATIKGLFNITEPFTNTSKCNKLNINNEFKSSIIYDLSIYKDKFYVATDKGFYIINKKHFQLSCNDPVFLIYSNYKQDTIYKFKYNQLINIVLNSIYFNNDRSILYEYTIINNNNKRIIKTFDPSIYLNNLSEGEYVFKAKAICNNINSNNELVIKFEILPPFYNTIWFKLILLFFIVLFITFLIYVFYKRLILNTKIAELQTLSLQSQMNPHFIFNAMNSLNSFIYSNHKNDANTFLSKISSLIRKSLDYSTINEVTLEEEIGILNNYLEIEKMRFVDKLEYDIRIDRNITIEEIYVPPFFTQIMAENAIIHGISKIDNIGKIDIDFIIENEQLIYTVKDNGKGIVNNLNKKHQSKGLKILNQRIQIFNNNDEENIKIENIIMHEQIIGTRVTLKLIIKK